MTDEPTNTIPVASDDGLLPNLIGGEWRSSSGGRHLAVFDPATGRRIARVPMSPPADVHAAVEGAASALREWRRIPPTERVQVLFRFKHLLEDSLETLARSVTLECGKTLAESRGEIRRGIENVETACGIPALLQGYCSEEIARGIDEIMFRQPVGVVAAVTPFNFPCMIPLWFLPYAIACGNAFLLKPSEKTPMTSRLLMELLLETGLPKGIVSLVHGGSETVDAILDHPGIGAVSFVGSTPTARALYARAAANGKRVQCQGGARNPVVVMPDADMDSAAHVIADAGYGCAGQRCLALSLVIGVESGYDSIAGRLDEIAANRKVGHGLESGTEMGPLIRPESRDRLVSLLEQSRSNGARLRVDGRGRHVPDGEDGFFLHPTILEDVPPDDPISRAELFGPILRLARTSDLTAAIERVNRREYGNMACIFTGSGNAARRFRHEVSAGNVGINVGVAAPMAFFPFSGWNASFFGDLHAQGRHAVEFYTQTKVVVERWPDTISRLF